MNFLLSLRIWLLRSLFTQDEKYMMIMAIDERIKALGVVSVTEKWTDKESIEKDCKWYEEIKQVFFEIDYKRLNLIKRKLHQMKMFLFFAMCFFRDCLINVIAFFDRNYNLIFNKKRCLQLFFGQHWYEYNDCVSTFRGNLRCLGNSWYIIKKR